MAKPLKIAIYVQHLLGTGHLVRMVQLARTAQKMGHDVLLVTGGVVDGIGYKGSFQWVPLLPAKASPEDLTRLLDQYGNLLTERDKATRTALLCRAIYGFRPDVFVLETYPFGRRQMRFELLPVLKMAESMNPRPLIVSSIRDVLQQRKPKRVLETIDLVNRYFDAVLVHGDVNIVPLDASFPEVGAISNYVHYTGYIHQLRQGDPLADPGDGYDEVIVSTGGGAVGLRLVKTAIAAKPFSLLKKHVWRILVGRNMPVYDIAPLMQNSTQDLIVESNRQDFSRLLARCRVSVSQAGYNSCLDVLSAKAKAVLVPFSQFGETEQQQRASVLHQRGMVLKLEEESLTPRGLAAAIDFAANKADFNYPSMNMQGDCESVRILQKLAAKRA